MRTSLKTRCEAQIRNEQALNKGHMLEFEAVIKLCALLYTNAAREVDSQRIKECKGILKNREGIFSNFRGTLEYVIQVKMALSDDPSAYIDGVKRVYDRLKVGHTLPGSMIAMAATTIYDNCPAKDLEAVVDKTNEAFEKVNKKHRFLTDESDMALIALMVMEGKNPDQVVNEAEEIFRALKDRYRIGSDAAQAAAMTLSLSDKPTSQKVEDFISLYEACKEAGHATSKGKEAAVYALFADLEPSRAELVNEIGEVDDLLKKEKGYGVLGVGGSMRRLFAATLVLVDRQAKKNVEAIGASSAVVQAIVEELVLILVMILVTSVVISSSASYSSN